MGACTYDSTIERAAIEGRSTHSSWQVVVHDDEQIIKCLRVLRGVISPLADLHILVPETSLLLYVVCPSFCLQ